MYAAAAINLCLLLLFNILAAALAPFLPAALSVVLVYLTVPCLCYHIFFVAGENGGKFNGAFKITMGVFLFHILIYSLIYLRSGLVFNGSFAKVDFWDALYFSITTWSTTGYGDFSPSPSVRLAASSQSLLGVFSMGIFIAIVSNWVGKRTEDRVRMHEHNCKIIAEAQKRISDQSKSENA